MNRKFTIKTLLLGFLTLALSTFWVAETNAQCESLACIDQINASLDTAGCVVVVTPEMALNAVTMPGQCPDLEVQVTGLPNDSIFSVGTYEYNVTNTMNGNSCWGTINVEDKNPPVLTCPIDVTVECSEDTSPENIALIIEEHRDHSYENGVLSSQGQYYNGPENAELWGVTVVECSNYNLEYTDRYESGGCDGDTIYRTFKATDEFGLIGTCEQVIYLTPEDLMDLTLPADYDCLTGSTGVRYEVNRSIGTTGTVLGYIDTDGTIGPLSSANIIDWDLSLSAGGESINLLGPLSGDNSFFDVSGNDFIASTGTISFNYISNSASYVDFGGFNSIYTNENDLNVLFQAMSETVEVNGMQETAPRSGMVVIGINPCDDRIEPYGSIARVGVLDCGGAGTEWNALANGNPSPDDKMDGDNLIPGTGRPGALNCGTIQAGYTDIRVSICETPIEECEQTMPSFKVVRQWKILDWCTGALVEHNQIIKVMDTEAPEIEELEDVTIGTSLWDCSASLVLPEGAATDNCSADVRVEHSSTDGSIIDGVLYLDDNAKTMDDTVQVFIDYYDCCDNVTSDTIYVFVIDDVPPVPVADAHTIVSLSQYDDEGLAKIYVETFDEGSFDNCGPIGQGVRRMSGTCSGFSEEDDAGKFFDFIHFCCKDVGKTIMVEYQVCDDADMDGEFGTEGDLCNTAMIEVEVQDKLAPACSVPGPTSIDCIDFVALDDLVNSGLLNTTEKAQVDALFGEANGAATCKVKIDQELTSEENCGTGMVNRIVTVTNTINGLTSTCEQEIQITADDDVNFLVCSDITFPAGSAEQQAFSSEDIHDVWCETNPMNIGDDVEKGADLPAIEIMDCAGVNITAPVINYDNLCSEVGIQLTLDTFDFAGGGCKKILAHWEIVDQCKFEENFLVDGEINPFVADNGYFELFVEYDLFDTEGPEITCGEGFDAECDGSLGGVLTATATDACTEDPSFFGWNWKFDQGADGSVDFEGEGNMITPSDLEMETFPEGEHSVTWIVSDGCGNVSSMDCPLGFEIVDSKAPTPYCIDGLSSAVMLENGVTLWAEDFNAGSFDNCGSVFVTIVPEQDVVGLDEDDAYDESINEVFNVNTGQEEYGWNFSCDYIPNGVSATIDVRLYATDEAGNYDYCTASFRLQDNLGGCEDEDGGALAINGNIATAEDKMVSGVEVEVMTSSPEFPKYTVTDEDGNYAFNGNPKDYNYEITPTKRDDYKNGVTTLDLLLIQKHLLNIETLDGAYKLIAADINNDSSIKVSDLLQLRKLILGLYANDELPNNDSWRFVDKDYAFDDATQPWPFDEIGNVEDLKTNMMNEDFMAVKVGDVNNSVAASGKLTSQVRNVNTLTLEVNEGAYQAGEEVKVVFSSSEFRDVYGYQFTLEFGKGLEYVGVEAGSLKLGAGNFGLNRLGEGIITTSYDDVRGSTVLTGEELFTVTFRATTASTIGESIKISSRVTAAEAYVGSSLEVNEVKLRTNEGELAEGFALYQNEPNPFKGITNISFNLPEAGNASLKVYDVTGKMLYNVNGSYAKGINTLQVKGLDATGVMYYQVNAGEYSATKKMIVIE